MTEQEKEKWREKAYMYPQEFIDAFAERIMEALSRTQEVHTLISTTSGLTEAAPAGAKPKTKRLVKPTVEEIRAYCAERRNNVNADNFFNFYKANGWRVGKNPMKDWKASVRTWEQRDSGAKPAPNANKVSTDPFLNYAKKMREEAMKYE